jgi:hypothetical protein
MRTHRQCRDKHPAPHPDQNPIWDGNFAFTNEDFFEILAVPEPIIAKNTDTTGRATVTPVFEAGKTKTSSYKMDITARGKNFSVIADAWCEPATGAKRLSGVTYNLPGAGTFTFWATETDPCTGRVLKGVIEGSLTNHAGGLFAVNNAVYQGKFRRV